MLRLFALGRSANVACRAVWVVGISLVLASFVSSFAQVAKPPAYQGFDPLPYLQENRVSAGPYAGAYVVAPAGYLNWYFANLGLKPFVKKTPGTVKQYLNSYIRHLTPQYTIRDVEFDSQRGGYLGPTKLRPSDSDDSYAATFLSLAVAYSRENRDQAWFKTNLGVLKQVANANLVQARYPSGLTHVFQDRHKYDVAYLEDNCEVYRGLKDFADYLQALGDPDAARYQAAASSVAQGIASLYLPKQKAFVIMANATSVGTKFYPDTVSQIFPEAFSVPLGKNTSALYANGYQYLNTYSPGWQKGTFDPYPWMMVGYVAAKRGDTARADAQVQHLTRLIRADRAKVTISELGFYQLIRDIREKSKAPSIPAEAETKPK